MSTCELAYLLLLIRPTPLCACRACICLSTNSAALCNLSARTLRQALLCTLQERRCALGRSRTKTFLSPNLGNLCERAADKSQHAMLVKTRSAFTPNMIHQSLSKRPRYERGGFKTGFGGWRCWTCTDDPREFASDQYHLEIWTQGTQYLAQIWPKVASIWTESDDTKCPLLLSKRDEVNSGGH